MRSPAVTLAFGVAMLVVCRAAALRRGHQQHAARHRCGCAGKLCRCSLGAPSNSRRFFGAALATATRECGYVIPPHPSFPATLRALLEPHLRHCRAAAPHAPTAVAHMAEMQRHSVHTRNEFLWLRARALSRTGATSRSPHWGSAVRREYRARLLLHTEGRQRSGRAQRARCGKGGR